MDIVADYQKSLKFFHEKRYDEALAELSKIRENVVYWPRLDLLTAYIYRAQMKYVSEIGILSDSLNAMENDPAKDPALAAEMWSLQGSAYHMLGQPRRAVEAFMKASEHEPDLSGKRVECSNALFSASSIPDYPPEAYQRLYCQYRSLCEDIVPFPLRFYRHDRLRVGYLSPDFREHPVAYLLWTLLCCHDRKHFRVYCYASNKCETYDWVTRKMQGTVEAWRDISTFSDEAAAHLIRSDEIDILFDLSGHTSDNRLAVMAYHPASVQISGIGDVNSTGMKCIEYFWGDRNSCRDAEAAGLYFTERILRDMDSWICYTPLREVPEAKDAPCMKREGVTFGCFNNFSKVTDEMLLAWSEILRRVPGSRLILKHRIFDSEEGRQSARERFRRLGIHDAATEMRGFSRDYLREYGDIDIALDTYPYVGCITTCEALYSGVPVISLYGQRLGTRFGYSILKTIGLEELAAASCEEYVSRAVALAGDKPLIAMLHKNLRCMMRSSPLMDMQRYIHAAEELYQKLWIKGYVSGGRGLRHS